MTLEQSIDTVTIVLIVITCCILVTMIGLKFIPKIATSPPWWLSRRLKNFLGRFVGFGQCRRCTDTWNWKKPHTTELAYADGEIRGGVFPLCEDCWQSLALPEERERYYNELFDEWIETAPHSVRIRIEQEDRPAAMRAVYDGK